MSPQPPASTAATGGGKQSSAGSGAAASADASGAAKGGGGSKLDRVLIRDTDHLTHFAKDLLGDSLASRKYADVVLHCAPVDPAPEPKGKAGKPKLPAPNSYPTLRVHRAVLASISDFLSRLLAPFPLEEDVHLTLDATPSEVLERIVEFAYAGEVKIAKPLVSTVCDAAHRMQIKFLKDSFVKITDQDYADVKAGKKTLASLKAQAAAKATVAAAAASATAAMVNKKGE